MGNIDYWGVEHGLRLPYNALLLLGKIQLSFKTETEILSRSIDTTKRSNDNSSIIVTIVNRVLEAHQNLEIYIYNKWSVNHLSQSTKSFESENKNIKWTEISIICHLISHILSNPSSKKTS